MNVLTIAGAGVLLYLLTQGKKPEKSTTTSKDTSEPQTEETKEVKVVQFVPPKKPTVKSKVVGDINTLGCTPNQYEKDGACVTFWDDQTEGLVIQSIMKKAQEWYDFDDGGIVPKENKPGEGYISGLCMDNYDGAGTWESNTNAMRIIKETIIERWPMVTKDALPPKPTSPKWLITIWNRVVEIYYREICGL